MNLFDALATVVLLVAALTACRTANTKTAQRAEAALMSQWMTSCHMTSAAPEPTTPDASTSTPKIYVEVTVVDRVSTGVDPMATPRRHASLLVESGVAASFDGSGEGDPLSLAATLAPDAAHVALDVELEGQHIEHRMTLGESLRVDLSSRSNSTAILTTYLVRSKTDLEQLYECKKQRASRTPVSTTGATGDVTL